MGKLGDAWGSVKNTVQNTSGATRLGAGVLTGGLSEFARKDPFSDPFGAHADKMRQQAKNRDDTAAAEDTRKTGLNAGIDTMEGRDNQFNTDEGKRISDYKSSRDQSYGEMKDTSSKLQGDTEKLKSQAQDQATNSGTVYKNLGTKMDDLNNQQKINSDNAMSLRDYSNASTNSVFNDTKGIYEQQAQNEGKQGQADYGVLASMGAQAMGQGMAGAGPMTAGAQSAMMAGSQRQAGEAYANVQNRMQGLRDQGLNMGFNRMDKAYDAGQAAQNTYQNGLGARGNMQTQANSESAGFRDQDNGYNTQIAGQRDRRSNLDLSKSQENYGMDSGFSKDKMQRANGITGARQGVIDADYASKMGSISKTEQQQAASRAEQASYVNAGIGAAGTIAGAAVAGPAGAAVGGTLAGKAATAMNPSQPFQSVVSNDPYQSNFGQLPPRQNYPLSSSLTENPGTTMPTQASSQPFRSNAAPQRTFGLRQRMAG